MKYRCVIVAFSLLMMSCNKNKDYDLSLDMKGQIIELKKTLNDSVVNYSSYYFNGVKRSEGILVNELKDGLWSEYDCKGTLNWKAYYWKGDRYLSNSIRMSKDTVDLEYKVNQSIDRVFCENSIVYFNVKLKGFHAEDFSFINMKNCTVVRCNNLVSGGFDFKLEVKEGDSLFFEVCSDVLGDKVSLMYDSDLILKCN